MELLVLSAIITILLIAYKKEIISGVKKLSIEICLLYTSDAADE